ncbi:MAG: hypothetical protein IH901_02705 [Proteobacteria bacterium]|nr:hypothetical protein [Pseudomonadota bacterium]
MTKSLKIAIAQINATVGDITGNRDLVAAAYARAEEDGADLVLFPELVITSYPPEDLILKPAFRAEAYKALETLTALTKGKSAAMLVGCPYAGNDNIYNALYLLGEGKILHRQLKVHLPNYGVFDEKRIFSEGPMPEPVENPLVEQLVSLRAEVSRMRSDLSARAPVVPPVQAVRPAPAPRPRPRLLSPGTVNIAGTTVRTAGLGRRQVQLLKVRLSLAVGAEDRPESHAVAIGAECDGGNADEALPTQGWPGPGCLRL